MHHPLDVLDAAKVRDDKLDKLFWRDSLASRAGKAKAITATARKLAVLFYNTLRYGMAYEDPGAAYYEERYRQRVLMGLHRRAKQFGYKLTEVGALEGVS
jgi:hypothetical protein